MAAQSFPPESDSVALAALATHAATPHSGGTVADASITVKGVAKVTPAPASPTDPIAVGSNHSALTNARIPTAHAASHAGGSDALTAADIGAATAVALGIEATTRSLADLTLTSAVGTKVSTAALTAETDARVAADAALDARMTNCVMRRPEDFGAARNGQSATDAAMTNGSPILTCASGPFVPADAGKAITVDGAGATGAGATPVLTTTILSYQSATQVTLAASSQATVSSKLAVWGTDDTAAIKSALDSAVAACQADKTYYCEVHFRAGIYCVAAATTKGGVTRGNAQIPFPAIEPTTGQKVTIVLKGLSDAAAWGHWQQTVPQKSGAVIRSMLFRPGVDGSWLSPSVFGTMTIDLPSGSVFSNIRVIVDGITVVCPINPSMIAMDLRRAAQADVPNFAALADATPFLLNGSATDDNGIGLYMSTQNNNDSSNIGVYSCEGFYYGIGFSDHFVAQRLGLIYCNTGIVIFDTVGIAAHGASIVYASIEATTRGIWKIGASGNKFPVWIGQVNTEGVTTAVDDASNNLRGSIGWTKNEDTAPTLIGATGVTVKNLLDLPTSGTAATTTFTPAGDLAATNVQTAIEETSTETRARANHTGLQAVSTVTGLQTALDARVTGPAVAVSGDLASFSGTTGKIVADSGLSLDTDTTLAANSDARLPSQKAVAAFVASLLALQSNTDLQVFLAGAGTWTKPTTRTPRRVRVWVVNAGSGGGAGRKSASGTAAFGGGAGPGGGRAYAELDPSALGATEPVSVGAGGTGGAAQATNSTNGAGSSAPNATTFGTGSLVSAGTAGGGGGGGSTTAGTAGAVGSGMFVGTIGGAGAAGTGNGAGTSSAGCGGGGGAGGLATTPVASAGGVGGGSRTWGSALGGAAGTAPGGAGAAGVSQGASSIMPGTGGGGGASSITGDGGAGGAGGFPGGGGGGGGAALDGVGNSGAGGNGGGGICVVITEF